MRVLTPSPVMIVSAAYVAARVKNLKIALLGPIVPQANPIRIAEELAMVDTMSQGRLIVGLLRGTTNEYLTFDLNPAEARERTDEGMELILKAWTEPQPFGWQGRYYQYRTVSVWPRPLRQPHPPTYALGTSKESCDFAARNHLGLGVSYGPFEVMAKSTSYTTARNARNMAGSRGRTTSSTAPTCCWRRTTTRPTSVSSSTPARHRSRCARHCARR